MAGRLADRLRVSKKGWLAERLTVRKAGRETGWHIIISSVLTFGMTCWGRNASRQATN